MRSMTCVIAFVFLASVSAAFSADEVEVKSAIVSVGLFKNGLAVVKREVKLPGPGTFVISDTPEPVNGTWSVQCDAAAVETRVGEREISVPTPVGNGDLQTTLAGKKVTIFFREAQMPSVSGTAETVTPPKTEFTWDRNYHGYNGYNAYAQPNVAWNATATANAGRFLSLETDNGRVLIDSSMIGYLKTEEKGEAALKRRVPALFLTLGKDAPKGATATISYLTQGLAWAPAYRVDISNPRKLSIEESAVIRNELGPLENTEVQLISGFPSIQFGHVLSPLAAHTTWATFFQQMHQRIASDDDAAQAISQQALSNSYAPAAGGADLGAEPAGEGLDIFYQSIGARTLAEGEALGVSIAKASADYERVVEWRVPDARNSYGQLYAVYGGARHNDDEDSAPWDVLRFRNPYNFPMTTAPASVVAGDRFEGQRISHWVNIGEQASVKVTRALSLRTRSTEVEVPGTREDVAIGGHTYRRTTVTGELKLNNHRKEDMTVVVHREFSGELQSADGTPEKTLREEGVYSVNQRNELTWTLTLKSGEEKTLTYKYVAFVMN